MSYYKEKLIGALAIALTVLVFMSWGAAAHIYLKAWLAQELIGRSWQQSLVSGQPKPPWPWADTHPVARLRMADEEFYVLQGAQSNTLAFGPGWLAESAHPSVGTVVIAAHRDTHFRSLAALVNGDRITLELMDGSRYEYQVEQGHVVDSERELLTIDPQLPQLKLLTCYPFDAVVPGGPLRYVLSANALQETRADGHSAPTS